MTVRIEVRRHSIKDGDAQRKTIGPLGRAFAHAIGEKQLRGRNFNRFFVSPLERTVQTLAEFARGAGDFNGAHLAATIPDIYVHWDRLKPLWRACHIGETKQLDMVDTFWATDREVAAEAQEEYLRRFTAFAASLPDGINALLVGHSPHLELIAHAIDGVKMPGLKECEGFGIVYDGELGLDRG